MLRRNQSDFNSHRGLNNCTHTCTHTSFLKSFILNWALTKVSDRIEWVEKQLWAVDRLIHSLNLGVLPLCWHHAGSWASIAEAAGMISILGGLIGWSWRGTTGKAGPVCQFHVISAFHVLFSISE